MTLTITDQLTSNGHAVRSALRSQHAGKVSCLPGRLLDRNTAITAMMLAESASDARRDEGRGLWPDFRNWAAELDLTGPDAFAQASQPSDQIKGSDRGAVRPGRCQIGSERDQWAVPVGIAWSVP